VTDVFLRVLNMSISAGILALVVLLARCLLAKRAPKRLFPILWGLVGIRLMLPFTVKSVMSLLPSAEVIPPEILLSETPALQTGVTVIDMTSASAMSSLAPAVGDSANPLQVWTAVGAAVWIAGAALMLLYAVVSTWRLRHRMREAVLLDGNVYLSDRTDSPFVLGIANPHIYVPFTIRDRDLPFVLAHERAHIARHDHWIKPAAFLLLSVYWFNPVLWIAYILLCRDVEMACDERVVKDYTPAERADYSEALLLCSVTRRAIAACPVAFGEVGVKKRIRTVLHYRRPAFWVSIASVLVVAVLAVCFLTDPVNAAIRNPAVGDYEPGAEGIVGSVDTAAFTEISPNFAIGADRYGVAVFQNPRRAWETFRELYADELDELAEIHGLKPLAAKNREMYLILGAQTEGSTAEKTARYTFVSKFLDIYENSFEDHSGLTKAADTAQSDVLMPNDDIPDEVWLLALKKAAVRGVKIVKESALVLYYGGRTHYVFPTGTGNQPVIVLNTEADVPGYTATSYALRNTEINMPSLDAEYIMLSSAETQAQNDSIRRLTDSLPVRLYPSLVAAIDKIDEVARIDPEPGVIGVGFVIHYRIQVPETYVKEPPIGCRLLDDGTYEAPPLYGMTLVYALEGYVQHRYHSIPSEELPASPSEDVYLSLLDAFWEESREEMRSDADKWEREKAEERYRRLGINIPIDYADNCDGDMRRRQILAEYLSVQSNYIKTVQMDRAGAIDFPPLGAEVSEYELVGFRDKVTVRDGPDYRWYEVALFRVDYRLALENPELAFDLPAIGLKVDGDAMVPDNGPILFVVVSEIDKDGNYTTRYAYSEFSGGQQRVSTSAALDFNSINVGTAVVELVREYYQKNP